MRVLLMGFSAQNAAALSMLIIRHYPECAVSELELAFDDDLHLCLPKISAYQQQARIMIVNVGGVGMPNLLPEQIVRLRTMIDGRTSLLVTNGNHAYKWNHQEGEGILFLEAPYTKEKMMQALTELFALSSKRPDLKQESSSQIQQESDIKENSVVKRRLPLPVMSQVIHDILNVHFPIGQLSLLHKILEIGLKEIPVQVTVGTQIFYINRFLNMALVANLKRLMNYCSSTAEFEVFSDAISITPLSLTEFDKISTELGDHYKKYTLNTLLWHMADCALPASIKVPKHTLRLKMRFMPNFADTGQTPSYVRPLASACLLKPRTVEELSDKMAHIADEGQINRLFLLAILSGMADLTILEQSFLDKQAPLVHTDQQMNAGVQKAQKTGFFKRLLNKLGF